MLCSCFFLASTPGAQGFRTEGLGLPSSVCQNAQGQGRMKARHTDVCGLETAHSAGQVVALLYTGLHKNMFLPVPLWLI